MTTRTAKKCRAAPAKKEPRERIRVNVIESDQVIDLEAWCSRYVELVAEAEGISVATADPKRRMGA